MSDIKLHVLGKLYPHELGRFREFEQAAPARPLGQRLLYALGSSVDPFGNEGIAFQVNAKDPFLWKKDTWWDLWNVVHDLPWRCISLDLEAKCTLDACLGFFDWLASEEKLISEEPLVLGNYYIPGVRDVLPGRRC